MIRNKTNQDSILPNGVVIPGRKLGLYIHFKGKKYRVIGVATHSETEEDLVIYHPENQPGILWARPLSMWDDLVYDPATHCKVKRFTFIKE